MTIVAAPTRIHREELVKASRRLATAGGDNFEFAQLAASIARASEPPAKLSDDYSAIIAGRRILAGPLAFREAVDVAWLGLSPGLVARFWDVRRPELTNGPFL
jgi:hypothetical protein